MPILIPIEFLCDTCGLTLRMPLAPGICEGDIPAAVQTNVSAVPSGWTLTKEGRTFCPPHQPKRLVEPVTMQDLGFKVLDGGKAR